MKKIFIILILLIFTLMQSESFADCSCNSCTSCKPTCEQDVSATLNCPDIPPGGGGDGGGGGGPGTAIGVGVGVGGGAGAAGAAALAFAPILLVGLAPNPCVCAACPLVCGNILGCACPLECYLQKAFDNSCAIKCVDGKYYFNPQNKLYIAQDDSTIVNGTYEIDEITLPDELKCAKQIKVNVTIASQEYCEFNNEPELTLGIYKDINKCNLSRKFETQQFLHHYLMKRYEIPLRITCKKYSCGLQKLSGTINMCQIENKNQPLKIVVRYTKNGFRKNQRMSNPGTLLYAYLVEFDKIR